MEFAIEARHLREILDATRHAVSGSSVDPTHAGVSLRVSGREVSAVGTDGDVTIEARANCSVGTDGSCVVLHKPLATLVALLDPKKSVGVKLEGAELVVSLEGMSPYRFRVLNVLFPTPIDPDGESVEVDLSMLGEVTTSVRAAVNKEHHGVQVVSEGSTLSFYATDHYRMHAVVLNGVSLGSFSGVVPLSVLERAAHHGAGAVVLDANGKTVKFLSDRVSITSRLLGVSFPNVSAPLAVESAQTVKIDVSLAREALARLASVSDGSSITVTGGSDGLQFAASNNEVGSGSETLRVATEEMRFIMDRQYLLDALNSQKSEEVSLGYTSATAPVFIKSGDNPSVVCVVMPMRV
jgi:DNA polymerase-3 subunit beta